jgi:NitT/TauT family transport system permease protein
MASAAAALRRGGSRIPPGAVSLLAGALIWEIVGQVANFDFFPPLSAVLVRLVEMIEDGEIVGNLATSLSNLAVGFGIAAVAGIAIGLAMGMYRRVEMALDVYVNALLTAPALIFAPVLFSIFGLSSTVVVAVVILYALFIIIINTAAGVRNAPPQLVEMARSFGAGDLRIAWRVLIPAAMPMIMAGLRLGMGRAVKGMINGEMFIAVIGLGRVVTRAGDRFDSESVLAVLIVIIIVALAAVKLVQLLDRRLTGWAPSAVRV